MPQVQGRDRAYLEPFSAIDPDSSRVASCGLETADGRAVWNYAKERDFAIVSEDTDVHYLDLLEGFEAVGREAGADDVDLRPGR